MRKMLFVNVEKSENVFFEIVENLFGLQKSWKTPNIKSIQFRAFAAKRPCFCGGTVFLTTK